MERIPFISSEMLSLHAIASVVERIRRDRRLKAMVTANGSSSNNFLLIRQIV